MRVLPFTYEHEKNKTRERTKQRQGGGKRGTAANSQREEVVHVTSSATSCFMFSNVKITTIETTIPGIVKYSASVVRKIRGGGGLSSVVSSKKHLCTTASSRIVSQGEETRLDVVALLGDERGSEDWVSRHELVCSMLTSRGEGLVRRVKNTRHPGWLRSVTAFFVCRAIVHDYLWQTQPPVYAITSSSYNIRAIPPGVSRDEMQDDKKKKQAAGPTHS